MFSRILTVALALTVAGCATQTRPTPLAANHPANPDAPEAPLPPPSQTLAGAATRQGSATADDHDMSSMHHGGMTMPATTAATSPAAAAYVCPMHKQVTSNQPGVCPICHMKLVPNIPHDAATHGAHQ
jgi:hypothetical protein